MNLFKALTDKALTDQPHTFGIDYISVDDMHLPFDRHYSSAGLSPGMGGGSKNISLYRKPLPHDHKLWR